MLTRLQMAFYFYLLAKLCIQMVQIPHYHNLICRFVRLMIKKTTRQKYMNDYFDLRAPFRFSNNTVVVCAVTCMCVQYMSRVPLCRCTHNFDVSSAQWLKKSSGYLFPLIFLSAGRTVFGSSRNCF